MGQNLVVPKHTLHRGTVNDKPLRRGRCPALGSFHQMLMRESVLPFILLHTHLLMPPDSCRPQMEAAMGGPPVSNMLKEGKSPSISPTGHVEPR